jgi:hypothetical protein
MESETQLGTTETSARTSINAPRKSGGGKVGFLLTEVDVEPQNTLGNAGTSSPTAELEVTKAGTTKSLVPASPGGEKSNSGNLHFISVYRVEDAELPAEAICESALAAPLPATIPRDKVEANIVRNLDFKAWSENARTRWEKDFKSPPSRAVISDTFWYCICWYFKTGKHEELESRLFDRISANFVALFSAVQPARKDFFFRCYADAVAQAVLYAMFLAYPKSRVHFTEKFRKDLIIRISYWTTGVCPEFVDARHWKLNLGGGDVLQSTTSQTWHRGANNAASRAGGAGGSSQRMLSVDSLAGRRTSLAHRAPRPLRTLRYSPLVNRFLTSRRYSSVNLVRATRMSMTTAEVASHLLSFTHPADVSY